LLSEESFFGEDFFRGFGRGCLGEGFFGEGSFVPFTPGLKYLPFSPRGFSFF